MIKLWGNYGGVRGQEFWNNTGFYDAYLNFLQASPSYWFFQWIDVL